MGGGPAGDTHIHLDIEVTGNRAGDQFADLVLKREDVRDRPVVSFGPDGLAGFQIGQAQGDADVLAGAPYGSGDDKVGFKCFTDCRKIRRGTAKHRRGVLANHRKLAEADQPVGDIAGDTRWVAFVPRAGDIVVSTPLKSGTTWTQGILAMLIAGDPAVDAQTSMKSPWIDINIRDLGEVMARLEAQEHRRQVKTHTPFDGIPFRPQIRYVTVYRHPIDVHFSYRKHLANMARDVGQAPLSEDPSNSFREFLAEDVDHRGLGPILDH